MRSFEFEYECECEYAELSNSDAMKPLRFDHSEPLLVAQETRHLSSPVQS